MLKSRFYTGVILILAFVASQFNSLHLHAHTSAPHKQVISAENANHSLEEICTICEIVYTPSLPTESTYLKETNFNWIEFVHHFGFQFSLTNQKSFQNKAPPTCS